MKSCKLFFTLVFSILGGTLYGQVIQFIDRTSLYQVGSNADTRGVAFFDYDNDGFDDIYVVITDPQVSHILYRNHGTGIPFSNATDEANLHLNTQGYSITTGDYNNDGMTDIFTTNHGNDLNLVYKNIGGSPVTYAIYSGSVEGNLDDAGCTWLDYNNDGLLDLFLVDHHGQGGGFFLYRNNGNDSFVRDTETLDEGITGYGQCMIAADFNNDGDIDIYITSYQQGNSESTYLEYFSNLGRYAVKRFAGGALNEDVNQAQGVTAGDYNNDGWLDLYIANDGIGENCVDKLYKNNGNGTFTEFTEDAHIVDNTSSYSPQFADFDNDGWLDLFIVKPLGNISRLYHNNGDGTFTDITTETEIIHTNARGSAISDFDNDGRLDMYIGNFESPNILLWNGTQNANHFIKFKLVGVQSNHSAINSRVSLFENGQFSQMREITASSGFMSQNSKIIHFGLGQQSEIDEARIQWSSGTVEIAHSLMADQTYTIVEGAPSAPHNLSISGNYGDHPNLNWEPPQEHDIKRYLIYRNIRWDRYTQTGWQLQGTSAETHWMDMNFLIGGPIATAYYKVLAQDYTDNNSGFSNTVSVVGAPGLSKPTEPRTQTNDDLPLSAVIKQNYPNPFNPTTVINYGLSEDTYVSIVIYDISGKMVKTLVNDYKPAGWYDSWWDGKNDANMTVPTGIYFTRFKTSNYSRTIKMLYQK